MGELCVTMGEGAISTGSAGSPPPTTGISPAATDGAASTTGLASPDSLTAPVVAGSPGSEDVRAEKKEARKAEAKEVQRWEQGELERHATSRDVRRVIEQRTVDQLKLQPAEQPKVEDALQNLLKSLAPQEVGKSETGKAASSDPTTSQDAADVSTSQQIRGSETAADSGKAQADPRKQDQQAILRGDKAAPSQGEKAPKSPLTQLLKNSGIPSDSIKDGLARGNLGVYRETLRSAPLHERAAAHGEVAALVRSLRAALSRSRNPAEQKSLQKALSQAKVLAEAVSPQSKEELSAYMQRTDPAVSAGKEGLGEKAQPGPAGTKAAKAEGGEKAEKVKILVCTDVQQAEPGQCKDYANAVASPKELAQLLTTGSNLSARPPEAQPTHQPATVFVAQGQGQHREDGNNPHKRSRGLVTVKPGEKVTPGEGVVCKLSNLPGTFSRLTG